MVDRINLDRFKNINFAPNKNVAKTTAALTLLLSTAACNSNDAMALFFLTGGPLWAPVLAICIIGILSDIGKGRGGGSPPSGY